MDIYDFTDTSDLDPAVADRLINKRKVSTPEWAAKLVGVVAAAPIALSIAQVVAVASRAKIKLPKETTVRNWLNKAVETGELIKPSRQTYAGPGFVVETKEADAEDAGIEVELGLDLPDELADL